MRYTRYIFIDCKLVSEIYNLLEIVFIFLIRSKQIRDFDKKISKNLVTYALYLNLSLSNYSEILILILIINLD